MTDNLQPSARHCFVCGVENPAGLHIRFFNTENGEVRATYTPPEHFVGYPGILHGGIIATILDETMGRAAMVEDPNRFMFTGKIEIKYVKPVPIGEQITVTARLTKDRGRVAHASGELKLADGSVAATATCTLVEVPPEIIEQMDEEEVAGWKVYPME